MTVDDVEMTDATASPELPPFPTVRILQLLKDAQQQHGLRHGDYFRYRTFCTSKLYRVRKATGFTNTHKCVRRHKAKFTKKWMTEETFTDDRFIHIGMFEAERWWAQAMTDKLAVEDNPDKLRKRHSMRMNLKRAVLHAKHLDTLIKSSNRCDVPTKLEAQAYAAWLLGICCFEQRQWREAAEALKATRTLYEGLAGATQNTSLENIYRSKCREIQPQIRLCEFNCSDSSDASMSELMAIRLQIGGGEGLDNLIAEMRAKASTDDVVVVEWGGEKSTVEEDKVKQVIQGWNQSAAELAQCQNAKEKMALYEKMLMDTRDAIDKVADLIRRKTATNSDSSALRTIKTYLEFLKISGTAARYLTIIENSRVEKKAKPQDLLRLYDSVIENLKEVLEVPGVDLNTDLLNAYKAKISFYTAFRCHHMAVAYASLGKFTEADALFERASTRKSEAEKALSSLKNNQYITETAAELKALGEHINNDREGARAKRLADAASLNGSESGAPSTFLDGKTIMSNTDKWCVAAAEGCLEKKLPLAVTQVPPAFVPMPNKPLFFDLALNHIAMPDLEARYAKCVENTKSSQSKTQSKKGGAAVKEEPQGAEDGQGGLSGMVKGWFWGKN